MARLTSIAVLVALAAGLGSDAVFFAGAADTSGLVQWRAAVADRASSPVDIVCIGDSITEGYRASSSANRWVEKLAASLDGTYGGTTAIYRPAAFGTPLDPPAFALPWTISGGLQDTTYELGRKNNVITAGGSMSISATSTGFSILYARGPAASTFGSFKYAIDGGATTTVSAVNSVAQGGRMETVTGLALGSHTVAITPDVDNVPIGGIIFHNGTETSGFRIWEGGHSGYKVSDYIDTSLAHWMDGLNQISPDLVIIMLGRNEWVAGTTTGLYISNLQTLIANVRAASYPTPSVMLVAEMQGNYTPGILWSDYVAAIAALVASDGNLAYVDLNPAFGGYTVPPSGSFYNADLAHPSDAGMQEIADEIAAALA